MNNQELPATNNIPPAPATRENAGTREYWLKEHKELVTHLLAVAIVFSTIFTALWSFQFVGSARMEDAKSLLAIMSGLSGVVVGYYFGRVPAEAHASQAQEQMHSAVSDMEQMKARMHEAARTLQGFEMEAASGAPIQPGNVREVRQRLEYA